MKLTIDLNNLTPNITFSQLLDISPKLRSQLTETMKLKKKN